jgi:hypothetical protein
MAVYWTPGSINPELVGDPREGVTNLGVYDPSETTYVFDHQGSVGIVNPDSSITFRPDIYFENLDDGSIELTLMDGSTYGQLLVHARQDELRVSPDRETIYNRLTERNREAVARDAGGFDPTALALAAISIALVPVTGGVSLAIGEAILGAGAVGAATLGGAIVGSAISAVGAVATDGDVVKSAVTGAITGGAGANATEIGTAIAGGADNVKEIATALDLTTKQVTTAISNAVTTGVVTAAISDADVTTAITASIASSIVGAYTTELVTNLPDLKDAATLVGNVSSVATKATINGTDVGDALITNVGSIIGGYVADTTKTATEIKNDVIKEITSTTEAGDTTDQTAGTQVTLADGSKGVVSDTGVVESVNTTTGATDVASVVDQDILKLISGTDTTTKAEDTTTTAEDTTTTGNETKTEVASTIEVGDTSDQSPGTEVLLADGTTGKVSNSGVIEPIDAVSDTTTVGFKEPTGTVSLISDAVLSPDAIIQNSNSPTGFSDVSGNPINEDGTAYLDPNAVDVAPDNVNITTAKDQEILDLINSVVKKDETVATNVADTTTGTTVDPTTVKTDTTDVTNIVDPTATTTATTVADTTGATGTTGGVTDITDTTGVIDTTTGVDTGGVSTTTGGGTGTDVVGTGVDTGGGFRGTTTDTTTTVDPNQEILDLIATSTPLKTDTVDTTTETTPTKTDLTTEPITVTGEQDPTVDTTTVTQEEEVKPYTPFEEDFPLQTETPKSISPTVIPKRPSQPSRTAKNARLSTGLGIDTNVASLLGTGLSSRPDVSSTSEPYLLGKDDKRKDVWNTESLRGALGI